jgi:putative salt-induced outer membrane protein YdiY
MTKRQHVLLTVLLTCLPIAVARADQITFKNGDVLTGKIETYDGSKLSLTSPVIGKVSVELKDVRTFSSSQPIDLVLSDGTTVHEKVSAGPDGQITLAPAGGAARVVSLAEIKKLNPPPVKWVGNLVLGGLLARGNTDSDSFNAAVDLTRRSESDRITLDGSYIFGRQRIPGQGKHETADDLSGKAKYDYFFTPKFYGYGNVEAEHDVIAGLSLRLAPGVGVGYQWVETPALSFNTEAGAGYLYRKYSHDGEKGDADARLAYHLKARLNDKVNVFHDFEYLPGLDRISNYFFDTDAGIRASITDKMYTEFKVDYRYDSKPAPGRGSNDVRYILGVGWSF